MYFGMKKIVVSMLLYLSLIASMAVFAGDSETSVMETTIEERLEKMGLVFNYYYPEASSDYQELLVNYQAFQVASDDQILLYLKEEMATKQSYMDQYEQGAIDMTKLLDLLSELREEQDRTGAEVRVLLQDKYAKLKDTHSEIKAISKELSAIVWQGKSVQNDVVILLDEFLVYFGEIIEIETMYLELIQEAY